MRAWLRWQDWTPLTVGVATVSSGVCSPVWGLCVAGVLCVVLAVANLAWPWMTVLEWVQAAIAAAVVGLAWFPGPTPVLRISVCQS